MPFRFKMADADRTSHYLVFVSKKFLGYEIMRGVMANASSTKVDGVASFEYDPRPPLLLIDGRSVEALAEELITGFAGRCLSVRDIFERHSPDHLYVMPNYREALLRLEVADRVACFPAATDRRSYKGRPSLSEDVRVTFPRPPRRGASRSTLGRPASVRRISRSARPTA